MEGRKLSQRQYTAWVIDRAYDAYLEAADAEGYNLPFKSFQEEVPERAGAPLCGTFRQFRKATYETLHSSPERKEAIRRIFERLRQKDFGSVRGESRIIRDLAMNVLAEMEQGN